MNAVARQQGAASTSKHLSSASGKHPDLHPCGFASLVRALSRSQKDLAQSRPVQPFDAEWSGLGRRVPLL